MFRKIRQRLYADYLMPPRLDFYDEIIRLGLDQDYVFLTVREFCRLHIRDGFDPLKRYFVIRHDIDTDVSVAKEFFRIEMRHGIVGSYYFRLSTVDEEFMKRIEDEGGEASYHYEELATLCKKHGWKTKEKALENIGIIREAFRKNYMAIKERTGLPIEIVAAHGDFVNAKLGLTNCVILEDSNLRQRLGIMHEAYDKDINTYVTCRHSDMMYPDFWKDGDVRESLKAKETCVYFLSHPRHWRAAPLENTRSNMQRFIEGLRFSYM